tara:strand:+ start:402 stop:698 length:297 start_codon:yes stop_codon:yes gene_type:complete
MTDLEIDKALALAIGYKLFDVKFHDDMWAVVVFRGSWRVFDHRDWNVIGPIAEKYYCFPFRLRGGAWEAISRGKYKLEFVKSDTPQKAIALAVIGALK